ncbi:uncharacterized protein PITG_03302 [Phytophthora infestans T30-4]|uniref:Uncharacterized protein n=2 Tax=Phytophthora infestans TaxID=4787 RepID=D0MZW5_PHYIT|nr:uncharacterized protein PITG_03302 [Phytophthora infestans T30-4]EEY65778.1 conserved hypothetical protein [Phytophthora infestans T30-4]KAF4047252.1 hypothetical protein GN244_ATG00386 [Phytophthora infestans]KAF4139473.1 hypothetical protein GN958_ATG11374 [Phytophthora infestans]|eukprot:XP_002906377.1 conserved hypothetical protein [Phytophthora infestans T30-4]
MDELAKTLEAYAGGLQQSFESVSERVGQSLSQSAHLMRMMNEVMESAMLQNLWISSGYQVKAGLIIEVNNRSEIMLGQTKIRAQLYGSEKAFFSATLESLRAGGQVQLQAPIHDAPGQIAGFIELECISPGTQQPLTKRSPFRVFYIQLGRFQALLSGEEGAAPGPTEVAVASDRFLLERMRNILDLSPIDGILKDEQGRYRFHPEFPLRNNPVLYLSVKTGGAGDPAFQVTVSAAGSAHTAEDRRRQCQQIINELEIDDADDSDYYSK